MIVHSSAAHTVRPSDDHEAEGPVVEEHVERDQGEADEAGDEAGPQRVVAQRGRHRLHRLALELDRQRAVAQHEGQVLGLGLAEAAADRDLVAPSKLGSLIDGADCTTASSTMASRPLGHTCGSGAWS